MYVNEIGYTVKIAKGRRKNDRTMIKQKHNEKQRRKVCDRDRAVCLAQPVNLTLFMHYDWLINAHALRVYCNPRNLNYALIDHND